MIPFCTIAGIPVYQDEITGRITFTAGATIDADGANGQSGEWSYKIEDDGLDYLANAGYPGTTWYPNILVCDKYDQPIVYPGGGIPSRTAYEWFHRSSPRRRYVDSYGVPGIVVPPIVRTDSEGIVMGAMARATYNGRSVDCVVFDIGPGDKLGEISIAAARELGIPDSPRDGGTSDDVEYEIFPNTPAEINGITYNLLAA